MTKRFTVLEFKNGAMLDLPIYKSNPYVLLSKEDIVLQAGDILDIVNTIEMFNTYYDNCFIDIRRHDLHLHDNTKI